jgi:uracil-DNA glycosylase
MDTAERFVHDLSTAAMGTTVNQYACHDPANDRPGAATFRRENLRLHLVERHRPRLLLVGEAPSYRGCRFSGIAFTSERHLVAPYAWSSTHPRGWTEPSATIVHRVLEALGIDADTMLWNIVPTHPAGDRALSNRTPTRAEIDVGRVWLDRLIALADPRGIVAVGKSAASGLAGVPFVRHPANGGARLFADQLATIVAGIVADDLPRAQLLIGGAPDPERP